MTISNAPTQGRPPANSKTKKTSSGKSTRSSSYDPRGSSKDRAARATKLLSDKQFRHETGTGWPGASKTPPNVHCVHCGTMLTYERGSKSNTLEQDKKDPSGTRKTMTKFIELPTSAVSSAQGADVSNFQGIMSRTFWSPYQFGFAKATEGTTFLDRTFAGNWATMKSASIHRGAYHFFHPAVDPIAQAKFFVNTVKAQGLGPGDMLVADVEITSGNAFTRMFKKHRNNLTQTPVSLSTVNITAKAFLDEVHSLVGDRNPILVYSNLSVGSQLTSCTSYPLWIAWPSMSAPPSVKPWANWAFWQWGIVSNIDRDAFNGTAADLDAWINSFMNISPADPHKHVLANDTSLLTLARSRNERVSTFMTYQGQHLTDTDASQTVWRAGSVYYTAH